MSDPVEEIVRSVEEKLNAVDRALTRLHQGNYRSCQVCGAPIGDAALETNPLLANCEAHPELG